MNDQTIIVWALRSMSAVIWVSVLYRLVFRHNEESKYRNSLLIAAVAVMLTHITAALDDINQVKFPDAQQSDFLSTAFGISALIALGLSGLRMLSQWEQEHE